ncbi:hypothetical protein OGATHE_004268 [Ogataea polymorpha]|uniref:Uncharacterized protein n=1 Tax=Ogataea polymorpha TaxID=460523 RepID=A0A9P8P043_9ASCO|nr:hypothetical protein OGATHE_004268 [Ogataea polymorpha]
MIATLWRSASRKSKQFLFENVVIFIPEGQTQTDLYNPPEVAPKPSGPYKFPISSSIWSDLCLRQDESPPLLVFDPRALMSWAIERFQEQNKKQIELIGQINPQVKVDQFAEL